MITFIFGKPGGGKSLLAVRKIAEELRTTTRCVVTNLPLDPGKLNAFMQETYGDVDVGVVQRVRLLDEESTKQWWRYRRSPEGYDQDLPPPDEQTGATSCRWGDFAPALFVLDEIHIQFNSRSWAQTGRAAIYYLSQHRKIGDDVIMISQNPEQVDRQLRMLTQDWIHVRNLGKEQFSRYFKLPRRILWRSFASQPTSGREACQISGSFGVDEKGLANCYATMAGTGIMATEAKEIDKRRGMPFWWIALPIVAIAIGISYTGEGYGAILRWITGKTIAQTHAGQHPASSTPPPAPAAPAVIKYIEQPSTPAPQVATKTLSPLVAMAKMNGKWIAHLADGRVFKEGQGLEIADPQGQWAVIRGEVHRFSE